MGEETTAVIIFLGVFAAVFLTLGIIPLVQYFKLTHGTPSTATVVEHALETTRSDRGQTSYTWLLKMKYYVNGTEYVKKYSVCKKRDYMEAHPVGTEMKILVNSHNPKKFILPEDRRTLLIPGIIFTVGGVGSLAGMFAVWLG